MLYISVVAGTLLLISEVLGIWNRRHPDRPSSIASAALDGARAVIKSITPPSSPHTSLHVPSDHIISSVDR
jgi:hypothetical protein